MSELAIKVSNLSKQYLSLNSKESEFDFALNNISFEVKHGDRISLIGSNGSGKSTLLSILSGVTKPTFGTVEIFGRVASILKIGESFHPDFTGRENSDFLLRLEAKKEEKLDITLEKVKEFSGLGDFFDKPIKYYSQGMFLRLAFSCIYLIDADIYLLDEVLGVGDESFALKADFFFQELIKNNKTIIIATHNKKEAIQKTNKTIWIEEGKLKEFGATQNVIIDHVKFQRIKFEKDILGNKEFDRTKVFDPKEGEDINILSDEKLKNYENENLQLKEIKVEGESSPFILKEEPFSIKIKIFKKIKKPAISCMLKVRDIFNNPAFFTLTPLNKNKINIEEQTREYSGIVTYSCEIPANFLNSGDYFLSVFFGFENNVEQTEENFIYNKRALKLPNEVKFKVRTKKVNFFTDSEHYSINPALYWEIKKD
jgi:ABC-type polysaccharide/polyol phosphate transport system ATPase subunit